MLRSCGTLTVINIKSNVFFRSTVFCVPNVRSVSFTVLQKAIHVIHEC